MLFLAHCSFEEKGTRPTHGYFTYLVEAAGPDDAKELLRQKILWARGRGGLFDGDVEVYLDDLILVDVGRLPKRGIIGRYQTYLTDFPTKAYGPLPVDSRGARVVDLRAGPDDGADDPERSRGVSLEPFVILRAEGGG